MLARLIELKKSTQMVMAALTPELSIADGKSPVARHRDEMPKRYACRCLEYDPRNYIFSGLADRQNRRSKAANLY